MVVIIVGGWWRRKVCGGGMREGGKERPLLVNRIALALGVLWL